MADHRPRTKPHLLDLPPELRNRIYEFAPLPGRIMVSRRGRTSPGSDPRSPRAITQVCKQVRQESLPMYFHNNTFILAHDFYRYGSMCVQQLEAWLQDSVPATCTSEVKEVIVPYHTQAFAQRRLIASLLESQAVIVAHFVNKGLDKILPIETVLRPIRHTTHLLLGLV